jgi:hypothetical protein
MGKAWAIAGAGAWVVAVMLGFGASAWPEYIRPHPYAVIALGLLGAILLFVPLVQWFFPIFKDETGRPNLALTTQFGGKFALVHLGGDAAQHIQVEPIRSVLGRNLWIRFDAVDFLNSAEPEVSLGFRLDLRGILKTDRDMGVIGASLFRGDAMGRETVDYPVTILFQWNGKRIKERHTLTWHSATGKLATSEARK